MLAPGVKARETADWLTPIMRASSRAVIGFLFPSDDTTPRAICVPELLISRFQQPLHGQYRSDRFHSIVSFKLKFILHAYASHISVRWRSGGRSDAE
jgi:hypothetical protein